MTFERPLRWPSAKPPKARRPTSPKPRLSSTPAPSAGPARPFLPEELTDLPPVSLEGDVPYKNLGGCLFSGNLLLPSGCQGWPGGWGEGSGHSGRQPPLPYIDPLPTPQKSTLVFYSGEGFKELVQTRLR